MRRRGARPSLIGTMARTAVIAGTATSVSGRVQHGQAQQAAQQQQSAALQEQSAAAAQQSSVDAAVAQALAAQQVQQAAAAPTPVGDVVGQLERLAALQAQGILTPEEFAAQKAKILAG